MRERSFVPVPRRAGLSTPSSSTGLLLVALASLALAPARAQETADPAARRLDETLPEEIEGSKIARIWRFERDGDSEGWQPYQNVALEIADGRLVIRNTGPDPYIVGPDLFADASEYQFLALRARSSTTGLMQIFYSKREAPGFRESQMIPIAMQGDGESRFYEVDLRAIRDWSGALENLRVDAANGVSEVGAEVEIEWIALYQTPAQIEAALPHWKDDERLVVGFENRGGQNADAPIELFVDGLRIGEVGCLDSPGRGSVELDARAFPDAFWLEARTAGERIWRGRMRKPVDPPTTPPAAHEADDIGARPHVLVGRGVGLLTQGDPERSVRLAPLASLTIRGPGRSHTYYEFDVAPRVTGDAPSAAQVYEDWIDDPLVGALVCTTTVVGTTVRTAVECSAPIEVLRFEGPRMLAHEPPTHAIFPGLEYLEAGEASSSAAWTGPGEADRSTPEPHKITVPMIAFEYERTPRSQASPVVARTLDAHAPRALDARAPRATDAGLERAWVAGLIWDIDNRRGVSPSPPTAEFVARPDAFSYATAYLPSMPDVHENRRYATEAYELDLHERLELETSYVLERGTIEQAYERHWTHAVAPPPTLAWAAADEDVPDEQRSGPGSRAALERVVEISMQAYTKTLFSLAAPGWKTHIAIGEPYAQRRLLGGIVLGESLRSGRPEYAQAIGLQPGGQIEDWIGTAASFFNDEKRREACEVFGRVAHDGGIGYELKPGMHEKIIAFTNFYGLHYEDFGEIGATNAGYTAIQIQPLLEYAACTLDPIFVAAAERVLAKINSYTVPRGAQTWEIHMQTPDLYAAAKSSLCNVWGYRMTGDERYLDEAQRWIRTGIPFLYLWEPPIERHVRSVHVNNGNGEGEVLAERDPRLFYEDVRRQINPYASIPVFGTSWYAVTWLGIPVQWCGLAWGNAVRELDRLRPMPNLVTVADGVFRSGANQQADKGYLAGTLPDSWDVASALSRQPFIIPDRILEYVYRVLGVPYLDTLQHLRLEGPRWTHVASRALIVVRSTSERPIAIEAASHTRADDELGADDGEPRKLASHDDRAKGVREPTSERHGRANGGGDLTGDSSDLTIDRGDLTIDSSDLTIDARFFRGQNASVLVGGARAPALVRVNGRELAWGSELWNAQWHEWEPGRGGLVVRWVATGGDDRIEILDR